MCGIAGIWSKERSFIPKGDIVKMINVMKHRGPDAKGVWHAPGLSFGHRRLKILDLSDAANQPFTDEQDALIFNGRIFNYITLKDELSSRFNFKTKGDTEVLFRALQVWDEKVFEKINGQYAFAFYKAATQTLLLARDHVGICPLYILETDNEMYFASEIKPLLIIKKCSLDKSGVVDYFTYRYNIQNGRTLFKEIRRFPPAHFLKIDLKTGHQEEKRYWKLKFNQYDRTKSEIQTEFNHLLDAEITAQRMADVPVGMYLSGGIDSGALLCGFTKGIEKIKSFTLSFSKEDNDYRRVLELEKKFNFEKNLVGFSYSNLDRLEEVVLALEEPFGDLIICANYLLAENASRQVRVVLSGEGGDEAFCGYDHQRAFFKLLDFSQRPMANSFLNMLLMVLPLRIVKILQSYPGNFGKEELTRIQRVSKKIFRPDEAYLQLIALFNRDELMKLFSKKFKKDTSIEPDIITIREIFEKESEPWQAVMRTEIEQLTLIVNLQKQERFGMRFSMEGCVPFVSRSILEFAASLPYNVHNSGVNKKLLLNYSGSPCIKKKPFSLFGNLDYLNKLIELMDVYVTYERVIDSQIFSWSEIKNLRLRLPKGNILVVKRAMAILIFMVWWKVFRPYLKN